MKNPLCPFPRPGTTFPCQRSQPAPPARERQMLAGLLLLAMLVRLGVAMATQSWMFQSRDGFWAFGHEMGRIGASIASGTGFAAPFKDFSGGPTAWMPPLYPYLIGGVFRVWGIYSPASALVLETLQSLMSLMNCVLVFAIGKRLFGSPVGLIAAGILAVYPPGLHFTVQKIWSTDMFVCGLLVSFLLCLRLAARPSLNRASLAGVSLGLTSLVDPISCAFWPFALAWMLAKARAAWKTRLCTAGVAVLVCLGTVTPWLVRNYAVFGHFVFIKSNFATVLLLANTPRTRPSLHAPAPPERATGLPGSSPDAIPGTVSTHDTAAAVRYLQNAPAAYLRNTARRVARYWLLTKETAKRGAAAAALAYAGVLGLGMLGLVWSWRQGSGVQLVRLAILALPLPYYLTVVRLLHYRYPVEVFLMIFAGYALSCSFTRRRARVQAGVT